MGRLSFPGLIPRDSKRLPGECIFLTLKPITPESIPLTINSHTSCQYSSCHKSPQSQVLDNQERSLVQSLLKLFKLPNPNLSAYLPGIAHSFPGKFQQRFWAVLGPCPPIHQPILFFDTLKFKLQILQIQTLKHAYINQNSLLTCGLSLHNMKQILMVPPCFYPLHKCVNPLNPVKNIHPESPSCPCISQSLPSPLPSSEAIMDQFFFTIYLISFRASI